MQANDFRVPPSSQVRRAQYKPDPQGAYVDADEAQQYAKAQARAALEQDRP
jgi:hypothetical protein